MKVLGILLVIAGIGSALIGIMGGKNQETVFFTVGFVALGAFLIKRANKTKTETEKKEEMKKQ